MRSFNVQKSLPGISRLAAEANKRIERAAENNEPVFITGELGTEKALAAKLIHQLSERAAGPLSKVAVSWKLPPDLAQHFQSCDGGSLIIHLQKEFPIDMQYTLVEMATDNAFADPMTGELVEADVRLILMTSLDMETLSSKTPILPELSELFERQHIEIPPLRYRKEDIPAFVRYALKRAYETGRTMAESIDPAVLSLYRQWGWEANSEDLLLVTARAALNAQGPVITLDDLPSEFIDKVDEDTLIAARRVQGSAPTQMLTGAEKLGGPTHSAAGETSEDTDRFTYQQLKDAKMIDDDTDVSAILSNPASDESDMDDVDKPQPDDKAAKAPPKASQLVEMDPRKSRILSMAKRLHAQAQLLRNQMDGPGHSGGPRPGLAGTAAAVTEEALQRITEKEALGALEKELDVGLDMVHQLRRQLALLNYRQQQSAETVRDLVQRISLLTTGESYQADPEKEVVANEVKELTDSLTKIDSIIQRVSTEIPMFGEHFEKTMSGTPSEHHDEEDKFKK